MDIDTVPIRCFMLFDTSTVVTVVAVFEVVVITRCTNVLSDLELLFPFLTEVSYKGISDWYFPFSKPLFKDIKMVLLGTFYHILSFIRLVIPIVTDGVITGLIRVFIRYPAYGVILNEDVVTVCIASSVTEHLRKLINHTHFFILFHTDFHTKGL